MVNKYFPQLVASVVEKLNGKNQTALTYMYRDHLTNTYSQDGRWASITAEYTRVAADVVSMDAELPLKSRDKVSTAEGQIPKVGMKLYMSEKQLKDLDNMIAQRLPQPQILRNLFADLPRCIQAVYERIEDMFLSELSTGVALATRSGGTGVRVDVGLPRRISLAMVLRLGTQRMQLLLMTSNWFTTRRWKTKIPSLLVILMITQLSCLARTSRFVLSLPSIKALQLIVIAIFLF